MSDYKPRNKNPRIDKVRKSWSSKFDDYVDDRREVRAPCGFRVEDKT